MVDDDDEVDNDDDDDGGGGGGVEVCDEAVEEELEIEMVDDDVALTGEGRLATVEWFPWTGDALCVLEDD